MRIVCDSVGFKNFLSFGSKWQDIPFKNGVNFVSGYDKDKNKSNGAGKSSFLESIPFACFGKTARKINQSQIINWKNKKNCEVVFRFSINDTSYEVMRALKPNKFEIYKNGNLLDQDARVKDYQIVFEEIFGMDMKMFMSLVHSNVNASANILSMTKPDKRKFIEKMFGLEVYSKMNDLCNKKLTGIESKLYKVDVDVQSLKEKIENAENLIRKINFELSSKEENINELKEKKEKLQEIKSDHPNLDEDIDNVTKEIQEKKDKFHSATVTMERYKTKLDAEVKQLKKEIKSIDDLAEIRSENEKFKKRIEEIENEFGSIDTINRGIKQYENGIEVLREKTKEQQKLESQLFKTIAGKEANQKNIEKNLEKLKDGVCPVCGQDVKNPKDHYSKELKEIKKEINDLYADLKIIEDKIKDLNNHEEKSSNKKRKIERAKDNIYHLKSKIKDVGEEKDKDSIVSRKQKIVEKIEKAQKLFDEKKSKNKKEVSALENKLKDLQEEKRQITLRESEIKNIEVKIESEKESLKSFKNVIKEQKKIVTESKKGIEIRQESVSKINDLKDHLDAVKFLLKDENIKQFTIRQIMPYLNKQTNHYLSEVSYSFFVDIDRWLDVEIKGPGIHNATYDSLSGGERRGIDIAMQLGLLDISRTQAGIFPDFLTFDELLDSSIDGNGINEILKIIKIKQQEFGGKVFIISHRPELDNDIVDNVYRVVKENGYSKVFVE